jgi:hypothetical protein
MNFAFPKYAPLFENGPAAMFPNAELFPYRARRAKEIFA